jgi:hypothetical protein
MALSAETIALLTSLGIVGEDIVRVARSVENDYAKPKRKKAAAAASKRCPPDWRPTDDDLAVARSEGFQGEEIDRQLAKMKDYTFRTAHTDWSATFRNWVRNSNDRRSASPSSSDSSNPRRANTESRRRAWAGIIAERDGLPLGDDLFGGGDEPNPTSGGSHLRLVNPRDRDADR